MKTALVYGAGGFIGSHLVKRLKKEGYWVRGVDLKYPEFSKTEADDFIIGDLRDVNVVHDTMDFYVDEVYQLAAQMGGAGYIFTGEHDADVAYSSAMINLHTVHECVKKGIYKVFFSSSACMYPSHNQLDTHNPVLSEDSAYPANPDSVYGWEKLFSEQVYLAFKRNYNLDVRIARFHNIFGQEGCFRGGREKSPAAMCRKVAEAKDGDVIEVWGDGKQTRSFLYIDECIEGVRRLMLADAGFAPMNIGSEEMISINNLAKMVIDISGKDLKINNILDAKAIGVRGRRSDNRFIQECLGWQPNYPLRNGMKILYEWINKQVNK
jgi:nucleoside-diphosphate-sugar epimerase